MSGLGGRRPQQPLRPGLDRHRGEGATRLRGRPQQQRVVPAHPDRSAGNDVCRGKPCRSVGRLQTGPLDPLRRGLARSAADLLTIVARFGAKGAALPVLSMGGSEVDTAMPTGRLMLTTLGAVAESERALMPERPRGHRQGQGRREVPGARPHRAAEGGRCPAPEGGGRASRRERQTARDRAG